MPVTEDPCLEQSEKTIAPFLKRCIVGDEVAIRCTAQGILQIRILPIARIRPEFGRLYIDGTIGSYGGSWYIKTGRSTFAPYGQTRLAEPTEKVRQFLREYPKGLKTKNRDFSLIYIERLDGWLPEYPIIGNPII